MRMLRVAFTLSNSPRTLVTVRYLPRGMAGARDYVREAEMTQCEHDASKTCRSVRIDGATDDINPRKKYGTVAGDHDASGGDR